MGSIKNYLKNKALQNKTAEDKVAEEQSLEKAKDIRYSYEAEDELDVKKQRTPLFGNEKRNILGN